MPTDDELQRIYDERTGIVPVHPRTLDGLRAAYEAGVAAERERCARIADADFTRASELRRENYVRQEIAAAIRADKEQPVSVAELIEPPRFIHAGRDPRCVEAWPDCASGEYNPACCRFPKSCSADIYVPNPDAAPDDREEDR